MGFWGEDKSKEWERSAGDLRGSGHAYLPQRRLNRCFSVFPRHEAARSTKARRLPGAPWARAAALRMYKSLDQWDGVEFSGEGAGIQEQGTGYHRPVVQTHF